MGSDMFEPHKIAWTPEHVRRFWDSYSSNPSLEDTYFAKSVGRHLIDYVSRRIRIGTAVDFGCGRGDLIGYLLARHACYGVDQSPESVATVNQRFKDHPRFKGAFVDSREIEAASADAVFAVEVVEHLDDASLEGLLSGAHRVLKPGAHLVVTTPNSEDLLKSEVMCPNCGCAFHNMQHVRSWSAESLSEYLRRFGFRGSAKRTTLSPRNGVGRLAQMTLHHVTRRPNNQLIYIGAAVRT
jgi:SAM-dependent methyltransferase